jgi:signal transduction histidine kinase
LGQAKSVIELHGGQLLVRSMPGQGSVFSIRVPLHLPMTPALQHEQSAAHE